MSSRCEERKSEGCTVKKKEKQQIERDKIVTEMRRATVPERLNERGQNVQAGSTKKKHTSGLTDGGGRNWPRACYSIVAWYVVSPRGTPQLRHRARVVADSRHAPVLTHGGVRGARTGTRGGVHTGRQKGRAGHPAVRHGSATVRGERPPSAGHPDRCAIPLPHSNKR